MQSSFSLPVVSTEGDSSYCVALGLPVTICSPHPLGLGVGMALMLLNRFPHTCLLTLWQNIVKLSLNNPNLSVPHISC